MLDKYITPQKMGEELNNLINDTRSGIPTAAFGVQYSAKCHIASLIGGRVLYICRDAITAQRVAEEYSNITGGAAVYLPPKGDVLLYNKLVNKDSVYARIAALFKIQQGALFITTTIEALLQLMPKYVNFVTFESGAEYPLGKLAKTLVEMGFKRCEFVENKGEFSIRGDLVQIFPIDWEAPVRIDFFGDEVEQIRAYSAVNGTLEEKLQKIDIISATDFCIDESEIPFIKNCLKKSISQMGVNIYKDRAKEICGELLELLEADRTNATLAFLSPLLESMRGTVKDFTGEDCTIIYDEGKLIDETYSGHLKEHAERWKNLSKKGEAFDFSFNQYKIDEDFRRELDYPRKLALQNFTATVGFFNPLKTYRINCSPVLHYSMRPEDLFSDLANWKRNGYRVLICCGTQQRAEKLAFEIEEHGVYCHIGNLPEPDFSGVLVTGIYFTSGVIYHSCKTVIIGTGDIFSKRDPEKKVQRKRNRMYQAPEVGDYCVHDVHGIGIVRGMKRITTTDSTKDYVAIEYRDGDMLYVCVDRMDCLTKYVGGDTAPSLSRLGGKDFERIKERVKASIAQLTINLKKLYRERKEQKGFAFSPDNAFMEEFENAFEFTETEDQLQSINEIKQDMESTKVMDRLLCGDVGYGKTEVALRAAFKAILDGKQVALVAPTTILSEQHYMTCLERFKDFGIRIGVLNRFRPASVQQHTVNLVSEGKIDILIGTHRVFSKDVKFNDLGLLIIDEEQRFGVEHKEKLKLLKKNVDTLTLSATPIPRTLHMSLTGIRDISTLSVAPTMRIPVQTFVVEENDTIIRDAVLKELARDGQTFILYNRVESIENFSSHIRELIPEARIIIGHGQMPEKMLEENMLAFYKREYDVLISTTIIENGVDLPTANTIIVIDADRLGLTTLYQLKGRVGRSDKMAMAYFMYQPQKVLTGAAYQRLSALMEFSDLGSGFKIAMRDLEIRGAGNVLGKEQHGHMDKIGYELYSKLLKEELGESTATFETELEIDVSAYIPDDFVTGSAQRMEYYKSIAECTSYSELQALEVYIEGNCGTLPTEFVNLFRIARLKIYCKIFSVIKVELSRHRARFVLKNLNSLNNEGLHFAITEMKDNVKITFGENPYIVFGVDSTNGLNSNIETLDKMINLLNIAINYKK